MAWHRIMTGLGHYSKTENPRVMGSHAGAGIGDGWESPDEWLEPIHMRTLQDQLRARKRATPRLHPLEHGQRDPWAEQPAPPSPAPHIVAAVVAHTGCGSVYDLDTLRAAYTAARNPDERRAIEAAARVLLDRDGVPA